jgi:hypothetical protein
MWSAWHIELVRHLASIYKELLIIYHYLTLHASFYLHEGSVALIIGQGIYEFNVAFGAWSWKLDCSFF